MGGSIAVTIREADGTLHKMVRWTNSMKGSFHDPKFLNGDISEYMEIWRDMKADYDKNHETEEFEFRMTPMYEPYDNDCMYPVEYGLVVIDFVTKSILSSQGYTSFGKEFVHPYSITDSDRNESLMVMFNAGLCDKVVSRYSSDRADDKIMYITKDTQFDEIVDFVKNNGDGWTDVYYYIPGWTIKNYGDTSKAILGQFRADLIERGFKFSENENTEWDNYILEREDDDE